MVHVIEQQEPSAQAAPSLPFKPLPRPNFFLAVRVSHSPAVRQALESVGAALVSHSAELAGAVEPSVRAHITLGLMHLTGPEHVAEVASLLQGPAMAAALRAEGLDRPLTLSLRGLSHFRDSVLYLDVGGGQQPPSPESAAEGAAPAVPDGGRSQLERLMHVLLAQLSPHAYQQGSGVFSPHVTIAKLFKLQTPQGGTTVERCRAQ
eukprot:CAMPEP_0202868398 /NCGR_PEP_ID=MMETSP1391-20130828/10860_1 /ASSEMBLY_ACC=CAM_ASM_000867 /TAXON_ID=1034604 /ORGANISM="Chlamydomonas leiostraca, Strain SAG 11-49" /LENGTH=205 /DNA_ID=CAMNT_0049548571 /DNA_START=136 /DNA_END=750 /DNA_ORIENTATION=+